MFKLLETFRAVYETRSFSLSAEQLFLSQPTVSNQIKLLESELGVTLFQRHGRTEIVATPQADILYKQTLELLDEWHTTLDLVNTSEEALNRCQIVSSQIFANYILPDLMAELIKKFPKTQFKITIGTSYEAFEAISKHRADIAFIEQPLLSKDIQRHFLQKDQLVIAGDKNQKIWLTREATSGVYYYTKRFFEENNISEPFLEVNNNEVIVDLLKRGIGRSIISELAAKDLPFQKLSSTYQRAFYLTRRSNHPSKTIGDCEEAILHWFDVKEKRRAERNRLQKDSSTHQS